MQAALPPSPASPDLRSYLQDELIRRCKANPLYSLRSFARLLEIEPSALSKILHGKRAISPRMFEALVRKLALAPYVAAALNPRRRPSAPANASLPEYELLALDRFQLISHWYHYAILELIHVAHFRPDPKWIARTLGITASEVSIAAERLQKLGLLSIDANGRWKDVSSHITTLGDEFTANAFRHLQRQILEQALRALEEIPFGRRSQTSVTMAANSRLLPEAGRRIQRFRRELNQFLQSEGELDAVFQLSVSLFPVSKGESQ